jgi:hypothetical protein
MERGARAPLTKYVTGELGGRTNGKSIREVEGVMSVNGPAESSGPQPYCAADGEASPFAPKWARDPRAQRKVVALHLPVAPQLVPAAAPPEGDAAPAARGPGPSGPELLAEDAVLKRLLQRHTPDPQPLNVKPVRDPVGLALGMVARLVVAGCGTAAVVMLLLGIIPSPLRLGPAVESEVAPVAVATTADREMPRQVADAGGGDGAPAPAAAAAVRAAATPAANTGLANTDVVPPAPAPAPVPTVAARAAQASGSDQWALEPGEVERLVKRGEAYLAQGDIAAARLILGRAAEGRDARAAFSLAATYDPAVLKKLHVVGFRPDVAQARAWYEKAAQYGSADATQRLAALPAPGQ